jgi:hypothetical protein
MGCAGVCSAPGSIHNSEGPRTRLRSGRQRARSWQAGGAGLSGARRQVILGAGEAMGIFQCGVIQGGVFRLGAHWEKNLGSGAQYLEAQRLGSSSQDMEREASSGRDCTVAGRARADHPGGGPSGECPWAADPRRWQAAPSCKWQRARRQLRPIARSFVHVLLPKVCAASLSQRVRKSAPSS